MRAFKIPNKLITCSYITSDQALITGKGAAVCSLIRKHDHFTPTREIRQHVRALARNHPAGWKLQGHDSPQTHHQPSSAHNLRDFTTHYISCENLPAEATRLAAQIGLCMYAVSMVGLRAHLLHMNVQRFRRGRVLKAPKLLCNSTLGSRVTKKKKV